MGDDPTAIAARLSKGERTLLLETVPGEHRPYNEAPNMLRVSLFRKDLLDWVDDGPSFGLTPLGLAVRAILENGEG